MRFPMSLNGRFLCKIALRLMKVCYVFLCVKAVSDKVVKHSSAWLSVQKWLVGTSSSAWKFGA